MGSIKKEDEGGEGKGKGGKKGVWRKGKGGGREGGTSL